MAIQMIVSEHGLKLMQSESKLEDIIEEGFAAMDAAVAEVIAKHEREIEEEQRLGGGTVYTADLKSAAR